MSTNRPRPRRAVRNAAAPRAAAESAGATARLDGAPLPSPATDRFCVIAAGVLGLALFAALLAMILGPHKIGDYMAETDFYGAYADGARLIEHGRFVPSRYGVIGPGYEILLGLTGFVIPNLFLAAELLSLAATLITFGLWFALLRRLLDARVALAAAALYAVNTFVFRYGYSATTDAPAIAIQAGALYLLLARDGTRARVAAGVLAGLAFLTRYNAIYLLPAGLLAVAFGAGVRSDAAPRSRRFVDALIFAGGFFAPVLPWVIYSLTHGSSFSFQLHHNIAYEVFARAKGIPWDNYQKYMQSEFHNLGDVIAKDPRAVFTRMLLNVGEHLREDGLKLMGGWSAAAGLVGLAIVAFDRRARALWPVLAAGALLFLTLVPAFYSERYSLALVPVYAALGGVAFGSPRLAFPAGRLWFKPLLIALPLFFATRANVRQQQYLMTQLPVEVLDVAPTLRELKRPGDKVIARKPHLAFHAGVESAPFPFADSLPQLADDVRRIGARWMFVSWPEAETRPAFWHLLDTTGVVPGLIPRKVSAGHPAVLYEVGPEFGRRPAWYDNDTLRALHMMRARTMVFAGDATLLVSRGALERALGRFDEARASLRRALMIDPNNTDALMELGAVGYQSQDYELAARSFERMISLKPDDPSPRIGLGWAYLHQGREAQAAAAWKPVVTATSDPITLRRMVILFHTQGDDISSAAAQSALARAGAR